MNKKTQNVLLARAVDSALAESLTRDGYTVKKLSSMRKVDLVALGLTYESIDCIQKKRPPIPKQICVKLIHQLRGICCVCRGSKGKSFVIHHIRPWSECHSHDIDNLILLCPECHNQAHTKHELTQNLTPETLHNLKEKWLKFIKEDDKKIVRMQKENESAFDLKTWDYFNHNRIIDFLPNYSLPDYSAFFKSGQNKQYLYAGIMRTVSPYSEFINILGQLLDIKDYVFIDNRTSLGDLSILIHEGMIIILTANHRFKKCHKRDAVGPNQSRIGYHKRKGINIKFRFDSWECTSTSAYGNLSGNWPCTSVLWTRNVQKQKEDIKVDATCLAIGTSIIPYFSITPEFVAKREYEEYLKESSEEDLLEMDDVENI